MRQSMELKQAGLLLLFMQGHQSHLNPELVPVSQRRGHSPVPATTHVSHSAVAGFLRHLKAEGPSIWLPKSI